MTDKWEVWCPEIKGVCVNGHNPMMGKDGEEPVRCAKWVKLRGMHPQTGQDMDKYKCLEFWKLICQLEGNNFIRQSIASIDKTATEVAKHHATFIGAMPENIRLNLLKSNPRLLPGNNGEQKEGERQ
jgi:hypothetical protein